MTAFADLDADVSPPDQHSPAASQRDDDAAAVDDSEDVPDSSSGAYGFIELIGHEDVERESTTSLALFAGDDGALDQRQRQALVVLLKKRFISARTDRAEWQALIGNPRPLRSRLNDMFLELKIDTVREVAYKRHASPEGGSRPFPTLLYDTPWGREETVILVHLRNRYRTDQAAGANRSFVDRADVLAYIAQHRPSHATDVSGDARKAANALAQVYKTGLLIGRSTADRFEISGAIEVLMPIDTLEALLAWLREQNAPAGTTTAPPALLGGALIRDDADALDTDDTDDTDSEALDLESDTDSGSEL